MLIDLPIQNSLQFATLGWYNTNMILLAYFWGYPAALETPIMHGRERFERLQLTDNSHNQHEIGNVRLNENDFGGWCFYVGY